TARTDSLFQAGRIWARARAKRCLPWGPAEGINQSRLRLTSQGRKVSYSDYIVYVDESGDHSMGVINAEWPLFVLCFCIFPVAAYTTSVAPAIRRLKFETFGHDLVI